MRNEISFRPVARVSIKGVTLNCHFQPAGQGNIIQLYKSTVLPLLDYTIPVSGIPTRQHIWTWLKGSKNLLLDWQPNSGTPATTIIMISLLSLAGLFFQLDASSRSYSCATAFYLATQSSPHPASYLILPLLSDTHTTCLFTDLSPDPLPSQVSYRYGTVYPWTLFWLYLTVHLSLKSN